MKITYSKSAQIELSKFHEKQQSLLEELVSDKRTVLGDDELEITASDVKEYSSYIRAIYPDRVKNTASALVSRAYILLGITMMIGSFFYQQLIELYIENRVQALIFLMGFSIALMGAFTKYYIEIRRQRFDSWERRFRDIRNHEIHNVEIKNYIDSESSDKDTKSQA